MEYIAPFIDKYNVFVGVAVTIFTYVFGEHWVLFLAYLLLNIGDWLTGWLKSRINGTSSSYVGLKGIIKKLGYWMMIALAFGMSVLFIEIGEVIGMNLGITVAIGWFVLANLTINELRSIIENFVEAGYQVPHILRKGLAVAEEALDKLEGTDENASE